MVLTKDNYHSPEASMAYMGASQFKSFLKCESKALAKCKGEYEEKKTTALLVGSYVDAYFSNELEDFKKNNPEIFKRDGKTLLSDYIKADEIINFIEQDEVLLKYLSGEHQVIMTGEIAEVPFKIKIDSYFEDRLIVDQKIMKDTMPIWDEEQNKKVNFVEYYGYLIQGCIYQEIVRQNTGKKLPFVLAVTTKEEIPSKALIKLDQEDLDKTLEFVKEMAPRFHAIKKGEIEPDECGKCDYCKKKSKVKGVVSYHTFDPYKEERI